MKIAIREVGKKRDLSKFIYLPAEIHRDHKNWVPPFYFDEWNYFNPRKNRALGYCEVTMALACRGEEVVGRIMGIINRRHNDVRKEKTARFACLECRDDQDTAHALLGYVENWAKERGMNKIVGPFGLTDQDPEGFLVEGFEHVPTLATYYNFEYMIDLVENEGYEKDVDYVVYKIVLSKEVPPIYERIYRKIARAKTFKLHEFNRRGQTRKFIRPVFRLMNECFVEMYGFTFLDDREIDDLAKRYLPIVDPRFVKIVTRDGAVVAFILGIPNLSEGIRKAKGKILPFGIFKIKSAARRTKQLDLLLGAIKEEYRGRGLDVLLGVKTIESAIKAGYECVDSHHELESNTAMRAEMEILGGKIYKRYRVFQKAL